MKEVLHLAFERAGGIDYLVQQAKEEPKAFMGLLARIVPAQVAVSIEHSFDLGNAMIEAHENQQRLNAMQTIEQIPETPTTHKPLITKED